MSNFTSKKTKTINSNSLIKNQISNILQPVNGIIAITQPTNKILTQNAVSSKYYIPLLEKITGEQSITARVPLSFNGTKNTLSVPNLTITNLPTCSVDASNSSDLVNKSYANTYAYFDLSAGDRWYCEDWITGRTKGKFNWDLSANNGNTTTQIFMFDSCANFIGKHIGVLALLSGGNASGFKSVCLPVNYDTSKLKSIRSIVCFATGRNVDFRIGFFDTTVASNSTNNISFRIVNVAANDGNMNIWAIKNNPLVSLNTFTSSLIAGRWVLLEITKYSNNISYSVKDLTSDITYATYSTTISSNFNGYITMYFQSGTATSNSRYAYIDYIDWVVAS
jgi:hypothetical protein